MMNRSGGLGLLVAVVVGGLVWAHNGSLVWGVLVAVGMLVLWLNIDHRRA